MKEVMFTLFHMPVCLSDYFEKISQRGFVTQCLSKFNTKI